MGTTWTVQLPETLPDRDLEDIRLRIVAILDGVNRLMSTYLEDSQVSRFNRVDVTQWFPVHTDVMVVLREAQRVNQITTGAFDITVQPLMDLWGFGRHKRTTEPPSEQTLRKVRESVGFDKLQLRGEPPAIRKTIPELTIDLSAIAKGYAVDKVADFLESLGALHYLVEIGGEIRAKGRNAQNQPWRIGVERPTPGVREAHRVFAVGETGVATSGDYRNFIDLGERRYAHIIDPATGYPVPLSESAVTVIHPQTMTADALATALMVMGPQQGLRFADEHGLAVLFVSRDKGAYRERASAAFTKRHP